MRPDPTIDKPLDIDELMREIRADIAARLPDADDEAFARYEGRPVIAAGGGDARLPRLGEFTQPLARKDGYRLDDFLAYHDADFVRNAYRALLGREPDPEGGTRYLAKIRSGQLSRVDGLAIPFALRTARRVPVLGRLLGIAQYAWRLPDIARNHEMLEAAMFEQRAAMRDRINEIVAGIERALTDAKAVQSQQLETLAARQAQLQATLADARSAIDRFVADLRAQGEAGDAKFAELRSEER